MDKIIEFIKERIAMFGKAPLCNLLPEHGICINGFYLPLCARCLGIFLGIIIASFLFIFIIRKKRYRFLIHLLFVLLALPCLIDGTLQYFFYIESNNIRRIITGLLCGASIVFSSGYLTNFIDEKMKYHNLKKNIRVDDI